jgi:hypothetical protein
LLGEEKQQNKISLADAFAKHIYRQKLIKAASEITAFIFSSLF